MNRVYSDLRRLETFKERYKYLRLRGTVGDITFGHERFLNQRFYTSREWRQVRRDVIARDNGCDLGVSGYEIHDRVIIHHMNPMDKGQVVQFDEDLLNPDFLITTSHQTHNALHYGVEEIFDRPVFVERRPGDTLLW